jgi:hypothetical protein
MPSDTPALTEPEVLHHALRTLHDHLPLQAEGYSCTTDELFKVLLGVAVKRGTIEAVCADLAGTPDPQTIRGYLNKQLRGEELPEVERHLNEALAAELPPRVRRHTREVAIDYPERPYYGKGAQAQELWVRGQATEGTTRFYRVATAYVVLHGLRLTLALRVVLPDDATVSVVAALLKQVQRLGIPIACLRLDKGFASMAGMAYLTRQQQPACIACPIRGTRGGSRARCQGRRSYCPLHPVRGEHGAAFTAAVAVCRVFTTARRTQRLQRRAEWLVFSLLHLALSPRAARQLYRERFGIETRYRCAGRVRGWTTSRNPASRFVLLALAVVLLNVWGHLRWLFTQVPRRGGRWLAITRFPLTRFVAFIRRTLEYLYGCTQMVIAPATPRC